MRFHRAISVVALVAFAPVAVGCSTAAVRPVATGPTLPAEPLEISAYTDRAGVRHEWGGTVQAAGPDSLLFRRSAIIDEYWGYRAPVAPDPVELLLAACDVASIEERQPDAFRSSYAIWAVGIGVMILFGVMLGVTGANSGE